MRASVTHHTHIQNAPPIEPEIVAADNALGNTTISKGSSDWYATADTTVLTKVYVGTGDEDRTAYWSTTMPARTVDAHAKRPAPVPDTSPGSVRVQLGYLAAPVMIWATQPDPSGYPDYGENEYVMYGGTIGGPPFFIPCEMRVANGSQADIGQLQNWANWELSRTLPHALPRRENAAADHYSFYTLFPQFRSDYPGDGFVTLPGLGFSTMNGLPASNGDFGKRDLKHFLQGSTLAVAPIEIFYASTYYSHPPGSVVWCDTTTNPHQHLLADNHSTPNWFYYYSQVYTTPFSISISYDPVGFKGQGRSNAPLGLNHVHISNDAHGFSQTTLGGYRPEYKLSDGRMYPVQVGVQNTLGIDTFACVIAHEAAHKQCEAEIQGGRYRH